jgi:hypothetical protein
LQKICQAVHPEKQKKHRSFLSQLKDNWTLNTSRGQENGGETAEHSVKTETIKQKENKNRVEHQNISVQK